MRFRAPRPRARSGPGDADPNGPGQRRGRRFGAHMVEPAIDAAVAACVRHDLRSLAGTVALLAEGPAAEGPSGAGRSGGALVDQALARRLLAAVGEAWGLGWQPADLALLASRDLTRRHARLVAEAVVRDAALYPPAAVPRRWRDQVDGLAARYKVGGGGRAKGSSSADGWAVAAPASDRAAGVRLAIEALALLTRVPPVPKLGAAPGEPTAAGGAAAGAAAAGGAGAEAGEVDARVLGRVRGLLAKAESTTFPDEAEALTAKAQELMARYAIDVALVAAEHGRAPEVGGRRLGVEDPYAAAKAMLLEAIAQANRCRSVWSKAYGYATVFGDESDLDGVELLYTSLLVQAAHAMLGAGPAGRSPASSAGRTRSYRQSFLVSFAVRIGDRLTEAVEAATEAAAEAASLSREALLPVLADQRAAAEAACEAAFPEVKATRLSARDWAGWYAGKAAADSAQLDLHTPVPARRRKQLG